ncbi:HlyD family type I secretion periplasmic adaptor subunit [Methylomonas sp. 2BW1-5-20]|uniref:HlyD family type I secretion periplasmic adaptor subunit n=1 Tax=Methylomonas sp. 2BW1-5-20 TaxID=3376686 RepID=UPI0040519FA0
MNQLSEFEAVALVTDDRPIRHIGNMVIIATIGIFGVWSYFAPLDSSALAPGFVAVKSHRKTVQHLDGGIVRELLVKDGSVVNEGDVMIRLDDTAIKAEQDILRSQQITLSAQVARLTAERDRKERIEFPESLEDDSDPRTVEAKLAETRIFQARKLSHEGEVSMLKQRSNQLSTRVGGLQGQRAAKQALSESYKDELKDLRELLAEGFTGKQRVRDIDRNLTLATGEMAALTAEIASDQIQIAEAQLQILQSEKQFQEGIAGKLGESQAQFYDVSQRLIAAREKMARTEIRAPSGGRVLGLTVHNPGTVISPGRPILDVVPQKEELVVTAQVSTMDIDRVHEGLKAEVRFSAFKQALAPKVEGKVAVLSADRLSDERTGMSYYQAQIELTPESYQKLGEIELLPGMPAEVLINTGERTVLEYLLQPITNAVSRAFIED